MNSGPAINRILLTGAAGFIGWETANILLADSKIVIGIDPSTTITTYGSRHIDLMT